MNDPQKCDECSSRTGLHPFLWHLFGGPVRFCPQCAGKICAGLVRYFKGRARDGVVKSVPRNPDMPIRDSVGTYRCRQCEVQLKDGWHEGESPFCVECRR
jgi:hypothetical protein